jgi:predicted nucleic acid-binding protein
VSVPLVVYDTMVFLQAAVHPQRQYATFAAVEDGRLQLCISTELLAEIRDVLTRPSLVKKFPALTPQRVTRFLDRINAVATSQHPDDDHLFNLAICAKAN